MARNELLLTEEEIARKFGCPIGSPEFAAARALALSRPDNTLNDMPTCLCPHCGEEWREDGHAGPEVGDEFTCPSCEHPCHVTFVDITVHVTLSTEPDE